jgi:hypothetical protein
MDPRWTPVTRRLARPTGLEPVTHSLEVAWFVSNINALCRNVFDIVGWRKMPSLMGDNSFRDEFQAVDDLPPVILGLPPA